MNLTHTDRQKGRMTGRTIDEEENTRLLRSIMIDMKTIKVGMDTEIALAIGLAHRYRQGDDVLQISSETVDIDRLPGTMMIGPCLLV
jgi:hypothetical protein